MFVRVERPCHVTPKSTRFRGAPQTRRRVVVHTHRDGARSMVKRAVDDDRKPTRRPGQGRTGTSAVPLRQPCTVECERGGGNGKNENTLHTGPVNVARARAPVFTRFGRCVTRPARARAVQSSRYHSAGQLFAAFSGRTREPKSVRTHSPPPSRARCLSADRLSTARALYRFPKSEMNAVVRALLACAFSASTVLPASDRQPTAGNTVGPTDTLRLVHAVRARNVGASRCPERGSTARTALGRVVEASYQIACRIESSRCATARGVVRR